MVDDLLGKYVVIRTYSAGVHCGTLKSLNGKEAILTNARRIWSWKGAFTLSAVAQNGILDGKLTLPVLEIYLSEAIEVILCSDKSKRILQTFKEHKP
jgi:hypothetical protein